MKKRSVKFVQIVIIATVVYLTLSDPGRFTICTFIVKFVVKVFSTNERFRFVDGVLQNSISITTDCVIARILAEKSNSDSHNEMNNAPNKLKEKKSSKLQDTEKYILSTSSYSENIFDVVKYKSEKVHVSQTERVPFGIKFR